MARLSENEELESAWRALATTSQLEVGWRSIPLAYVPNGRLRAGRHFPENTEALLMSFVGISAPSAKSLPNGRGFDVCLLDAHSPKIGTIWIALCRRPEASLDLFSTMANDLAAVLTPESGVTEQELLNLCLRRIRAWQDFMGRDASDILAPEEELGLFGELTILETLVNGGLRPDTAVNAWQGPEHGLQDFHIGHGAVEVKSSLSPRGFPARIASLDQLDDAIRQPLIIAAVRIKIESSGSTLPELALKCRNMVNGGESGVSEFDSKLVHAGYIYSSADRYRRRLSPIEIRFISLDEKFPRLTRQTVPLAITHSSYTVDIDMVSGAQILSLNEALEKLGAL